MPGFRKKAGRKFLLQQHMAAGERIERGGTKRIAELFHVKHRRGNVCVNVSRETLGIVARCAGDAPLFKRWERFFAHCVSGMRLQPPLLFLLLRKRKRKRISALRASLRSVALRNAPAGAGARYKEKEGLLLSVCGANPTGAE